MPADLPASLTADVRGEVAQVTLSRPAKRNALDDATVLGLEAFFTTLPAHVRVVVLDAQGDHFCAGLDLSALRERTTLEGVHHSRMWHRAFEHVESCAVPVVSVLTGAVIGGGLELAAATHLRVAESSAFYALPEGQRGLFVGGGASVRVPRLVGVHRMTDMMLTGRVFGAEEGQALGLSNYLVPPGEGLTKARELAATIATTSPVTTFAVLQALPLIATAHPREGLLLESLMAAVASGSDEAQRRMQEFLDGAGAKVHARESGPA